MRWAVHRYAAQDDGETIAGAISQAQAIAVCDGSYKDGFGTAAYVLESDTSLNHLVAVKTVPGFTMDQSSYRSELAGLYGVVAMVHLICEQYKITSGEIEVGCDSSSVLNHVFGSGHYFDAKIKQADYDLHSALREMPSKSPIKWKCRHVAGHQDDDGIEALDRWAHLNIEMNSLAKAYWYDMCDQQPLHNSPIAHEYWPVCIRGHKVSSHLDAKIRDHILGGAQCARWEQKGRMTHNNMQKVNWHTCEKAMCSLSIGKWHWIAKHISGHAGVGTKMVQWQFSDSAACPRCGQEEDSYHVWTCQASDARWLHSQHIFKLDTWLEQQETHPDLRRELINGLKAWSTGTPRHTFYCTPIHTRQLLVHQDAIGWTNLLEGCIATGWMEAQSAYY